MFEISAEREHLFDRKLIKLIVGLIEQVLPSVLKFRRVIKYIGVYIYMYMYIYIYIHTHTYIHIIYTT